MITTIAFIAYPVSHLERAPAFPLDCLDRSFSLPMTAAEAGCL